MKNINENIPKTARNFLLIALGFLSLGSIGGDIALIISPTGMPDYFADEIFGQNGISQEGAVDGEVCAMILKALSLYA